MTKSTLRECVEKIQLLNAPEERQRRLSQIPEVSSDPNMDPDYESEEDVGEHGNRNLFHCFADCIRHFIIPYVYQNLRFITP